MLRIFLGLCLLHNTVPGYFNEVYGEQNSIPTHKHIRDLTTNTLSGIQPSNGTKPISSENTSATSVDKSVMKNSTARIAPINVTAEITPNNRTGITKPSNETLPNKSVFPALIENGTINFDKVNQVISNIDINKDKIIQNYEKAIKVSTFVKDVSSSAHDTAKSLEKSFNDLPFNNQTVIVKNLDFIGRSANKSLIELREDGMNVLKSINESRQGNSSDWKNQITMIKAGMDTLKNTSIWIDPNFNPTQWMIRTNVPWKHVEAARTENDTQIVQICRFDQKTATCSAEYSSWNAKLWFTFAEGNKGMNISSYERGNLPRVTFLNKVNGTECARFNNGTFHQICVKLYGYERDSGVTRACLQIGAAIFNHGTASTDFGCFRFGKVVRHENALEGEDPNLLTLNGFILNNRYNNTRNVTRSKASTLNSFSSLIICLILLHRTILN